MSFLSAFSKFRVVSHKLIICQARSIAHEVQRIPRVFSCETVYKNNVQRICNFGDGNTWNLSKLLVNNIPLNAPGCPKCPIENPLLPIFQYCPATESTDIKLEPSRKPKDCPKPKTKCPEGSQKKGKKKNKPKKKSQKKSRKSKKSKNSKKSKCGMKSKKGQSKKTKKEKKFKRGKKKK